MKKTNLLVLIATIATLGFFSTSCKKDATGPRISILTVNGTEITKSTGDTVKVTLDSTVTIKWSVTAGTKAPTSLVITQNAITVKTQTNADSIASGKYSTALTTVGNVLFSISVTDKNDSVIQKTFVVKVAAASTPNKYSAITLGAQSNNGGSYFDFVTGSVIGQTAASTAGTSISYSFAGVGTPTAVATLIAPAVRLANGLNKTSVGKEDCYFQKNTTINFSTATAAQISALTVSTSNLEFVNVSTGDVVEFLTAKGTKGLIHVTSVTDGVDGAITFDVK
jgi:hypothetical protein